MSMNLKGILKQIRLQGRCLLLTIKSENLDKTLKMTKKLKLAINQKKRSKAPVPRRSIGKVFREIRIEKKPTEGAIHEARESPLQENTAISAHEIKREVKKENPKNKTGLLGDCVHLNRLCQTLGKPQRVVTRFNSFKNDYLATLDYLDDNMEKIYEFAFFFDFYKLKNPKFFLKGSGIKEPIFKKALKEIKENYEEDDFADEKEYEDVVNLYKIII